MEAKKFKIGDKVRVKSLEWYNEKKNEKGVVRIDTDNCVNFTAEMARLCGEIMQVEEMRDYFYIMNGSIFSWQDWMLENEVITEEKQEQEQQLIKNDMETKEMTKEEVFEFLKDTKILCTSKEESIKVQVALFAFGIEWISKKKGIDEDKYLLFINNKLEIQHTSDIDFWMDDVNKRIEPNDILSITLKEEQKPKFDPKSLQPFDKVLVRDYDEVYWEARFFDRYEKEDDEPYHTTNGCSYIYCVPYNEETKHLHNTTNEEPEYYKKWKM